MGVEFDFPQNADPSQFKAADWQRAGRRGKVSPSDGSVTPNKLAGSTTDLIDATAQSAATTAADAAKAQAVADANANATTLAASAQANAIANAAAALASHVADSDPHPVYLTQAEGDTRYLTQSTGDGRYLPLTLTLTNAADDAAAAAAGVQVGRLYRNGSIVMIRVS